MEMELCAKVGIQRRITIDGRTTAGIDQFMQKSKTVLKLQRIPNGLSAFWLFTGKIFIGRKYLVTNISQVLSNCIREGKITIQMSVPYVDIMVSCGNPVQLRKLVEAIQQELDLINKPRGVLSSNNEASGSRTRPRIDNLEPTPMMQNSETKNETGIRLDFTKKGDDFKRIKRMLNEPVNASSVLKVVQRENYPRVGTSFSSFLIEVVTTGIGLKTIDYRVLKLNHLQRLELSNNQLTCIERLKLLSSKLTHLILDGNPIAAISPNLFLAPCLSSLQVLSLANTRLKRLPQSLLTLRNLRNLDVKHSQLEILPYNLNYLSNLNNLYLSGNRLSFLPAPIRSLRLSVLDISDNKFEDPAPFLDVKRFPHVKIGQRSSRTLKELAAVVVKTMSLRGRIHYTPQDLPLTLYNFTEETKQCIYCLRYALSYTVQNTRLNLSFAPVSLVTDRPIVLGKKVVCYQCYKDT